MFNFAYFRRCIISLCSLFLLLLQTTVLQGQDNPQRQRALVAARNATEFLTDRVSFNGGYLWQYSADLKLREGEGRITTDTVWVQPPGTPAVGEAFVHLYKATGEIQFKRAAMDAADALRRGQMRSGGWQGSVEFSPERSQKWAYRVNPVKKKQKDQSSLDDDKTQSALRFLIQLDRATDFEEPVVHEMVVYGLNALLNRGQFPNGGFPQVWTDQPRQIETAQAKANYPVDWPRKCLGHNEYWLKYTLNDNLASDVLATLLLADQVYGKSSSSSSDDSVYLASAQRLGDFLIAAQMPQPQPAWAQQYNFQMQPMWARKFEPPAITAGETQSVIESLIELSAATGDDRYLAPIEPALAYLEKSVLPDGQLARFYELQTNRPLYFTRDYQLTYDDSDVPTHYSFKVASRIPKLRKKLANVGKRTTKRPSQSEIERTIRDLGDRPIWVTNGKLRYHQFEGPIIELKTVVKQLNNLAAYLLDKGSD